jgi:DNA-directed RNA polymerase specialized sigma subunit
MSETTEQLLLSAAQVAQTLGVSKRRVSRLNSIANLRLASLI